MPAYDYDIVSSFPTIAKTLIDTRHSRWVKTPYYVPDAIYGYARCEVTIFETTTVSPIIHVAEDGSLSTPTGTWETYLTKGELDFILKHNIGSYIIYDGWWVLPGAKANMPLQIPMNRVLAYKKSDNELVQLLAKRISVGIYGKFAEEHEDSFGKHFNPCWFAEISTQVRLQVAEFIYYHKLQEYLIHVSTDGCLVDKEIEHSE